MKPMTELRQIAEKVNQPSAQSSPLFCFDTARSCFAHGGDIAEHCGWYWLLLWASRGGRIDA